MIISFQGQKGGTGKTTISIQLAHALSRLDGSSVLLLDTDPQASARMWAQDRDEAEGSPPFDVMGLETTTIHRDVPRLVNKYEHIVIDGQGRTSAVARSGMLASDLVLLPCQGSVHDAKAIKQTLDIIEDTRVYKPDLITAIMISRQRIPITRETRWIESEIRKGNTPVLESRTWERVAYAESASRGLTVYEDPSWKQAATEIDAILSEILNMVGDK